MQLSARLGRCGRCIRLCAQASSGCLLLATVAAAAGAPALIQWTLWIATALFACWLAAHGAAYVLRGPGRASPCRTCAQNARAYRRDRRWRRIRAWVAGAPPGAPGRARSGRCRHCGRRTPLSEMPDAPPAAQGLRAVAERSAEFRQLVPRLARPDPADTWQADMLHYFLYELTREPDRAHSHALFVASWEQDTPVSVVLMRPDPMDPQARPAAA